MTRPLRATAVGLLIAAASWTFAAGADAQTTTPVLSIDSPYVDEGDSGSANLTFTVSLSAASGGAVTVGYADAGTGTATSGTDYTALTAGTLTFAAGTTSRTITVSVTGDTTSESDETVVVTLSSPTGATLSAAAGSGTGTIRDDDSGTPTLRVNSPTVTEGDVGSTNMNFTVTMNPASNRNVAVIFGITGGTATSGTDYTTSLQNNRIRLRFSPGQTSKTVTVAVRGDTLDEADETVVVGLSGVGFGARIATGTGTGTITDDDPLPALSVDSPSVTEGDSGSTDMTFTVSLSPASGREVRTGYAIYPGDGTATSGTDYTAIDGFRFLTFAPGETSKTFTVEVLGDTDPEADETVGVRLAAGPTNALIAGNGRGVGTITDDDLALLRTGPASVTEGDAGSTNLTFTLTLVAQSGSSAASGKTVTVDYADTGRGTATSGTDYTALAAGTVTFSPGDTSETITVSVTGDPVVERHETVVLSLSNLTNARFLTASMNTVTGTIRDDDGFPTATAHAEKDGTPVNVVEEGDPVTLVGSGSDPDGDPITEYRWTQTAGPTVTLMNATSQRARFRAPTGLTADEVLRFSLVVTAGGEGGSDSVDITVLADNVGWSVEAGNAQMVEEDATVNLSGTTPGLPTLQGVGQVSYSWRQTAGPDVTLTGAATATPSFTAPNLLADATLEFELTVKLGRGTRSQMDDVDVMVEADNDDPTAEAGNPQTVYEGSTVRLDGRRSEDPENEALTYSWSLTGSSPTTSVTLTGANTATPRFTAPLVTADVTLTFTLTVTAGGATDTDTVVVTVEPLVLMADAGPDQVVGEGDTVRLDGSRSTAPLGAPSLTYRWRQTGGSPSVTLDGETTARPSFTAPSGLTSDVTLTFELTVTVGGESGESETDTVDVTVEWVGPVETPALLTADAGPDQVVDGGDEVRLDGSGSTTPGEALSYSWSQTGGSPSVTLTGAETATPSFTAPDVTSDVTLTFTLTVTADGDSDTDTVDVTVRAGSRDGPTANAGPDQTVTAGDAVRLSGSGSDPDGDPLSYSWRQTGGSPAVTLTGAETATPSFTAPSGLTSGVTLTFTLTVTAGGDSATDTVDVRVRADRDSPTANAGPDRTVTAGDAVRLSGSGSDPDGDPLSYSWRQTGGSPSVTLTGAETATPRFTAPDVTSDVTLTFTLTVTAGGATATDTVDVTVTPESTPETPGTENRPPEIHTSDARKYRQGERIKPFAVEVSDPDGDAVTVDVTGLPPDLRYVDGRVEGTVAADAEARTYTVTVTASDGVSDPVRATFTITVRKRDLKPIFRATISAPCFQVGTAIAPLALPAATSGDGTLRYHLAPAPPAGLALDAGTRTLAGTPEAAQEETVYTWTARDEDGDEATLTFALTVLPDLRPTFGGVRGPELRGRAGRRMAPVTLPAATLPGAGGGGACGPGFDHDQPLAYRVTPELPAGLRFDARTRAVSGTPEAEQTQREYTLTATDADGDEAALRFSITVIDPPVVNRIRIVSKPLAGDTYRYGERIEAEVVFSEPVTLTGSLTLGLAIGQTVRVLPSVRASGATVRFGYTVVGIDRDQDGVSVAADALALAGGRLVDAVGTDAELTHDPLPDQPGHRVDGRPQAVGTLPDLALTLGAAPGEVEVAEAFHGAETYEVVSSAPEVAAAALAGTMVTVTQRSDGVATVTVVGRNPGGAAEQPFAVRVVTAQAEVDVVAGALAGVGRTLLSSTSAVVGRRMERFGGGSTLMLAGRTVGQASAGGQGFGGPGAGPLGGGSAGFGPGLPLPAPAGAEADVPLAAARRSYGAAASAPGAGGPRFGRVTADELLYGSAFETTLGGSPAGFGQPAASGFVGGAPAPAAGPRLTVWGAGDLQSLQGTIGPGSRYDARPLTTYVGADVAAGRLLAGLALARSRADADYEFHDLAADARGSGRLATRLLNVHPYVRWALDGQTDVWGIAGAGWGTAELARSVTHVGERSDLSLRLGMAGLRRTFRPGGAVGLALRGDAGWVRLATAAADGAVLRGQAATGHRTRVGLEVVRQSGQVQPFVEVGGRYDGGDGAAGAGLEVAGGVRAASGAGRVGLEARGRLLALHTAAGYREAGLSVTLRVTPAGDGRGLALDLTPGWGAPAGGADSLWNDHGFGPLPGLAAPDGSFTARAGYGLGLVAPFTEVGWAAQRSRRLRVGVRVWEAAKALEVELSGERYSDVGLPPAYRLGVFGSLRY